MKFLSLAATIALTLGYTLAFAPTASAGNWAVTVLDPLPEHFEAGTTYTIGYWVLQHGSHPYDEALHGKFGLRLKGAAAYEFAATPLPERAHFASAITVPTAGKYGLISVQEPFQDYEIGIIELPGTMWVAPLPAAGPGSQPYDWGPVHPPRVLSSGQPTATTATERVEHTAQTEPGEGPPPELLFATLGAATLAGTTVALARRKRRS